MEEEFVKDSLDEKLLQHFGGKVVRKDLTSLMKRTANVPTYVLEYLLGMYCSTDDPAVLEGGLERIRKVLASNYARPDESEVIKSKIRELGQYTVIDKITASLDERHDYYVARLENLDIEEFVIPADYVRQYTKMLQGGIWCIMRIEYLREEADDGEDPMETIFDEPKKSKPRKSGKRTPLDSPFSVTSLTPIQMPNLNLDNIIEQRHHFTRDEWMDMILRSSGYEPKGLTEREKLHFLLRLVPLIERNYNLCELGPRGTGKSHVYKEVSPYAILVSGGRTTVANLFGRMGAAHWADKVGLVGMWDCVTFDEVAGMHFTDDLAVQTMKDYMASGSYVRSREQINANASMVFEGNINDSVENILKTTHLFEPFPPEFNNDSAFFDRIHAYLPGWEIPKMRSSLLTNHYGLITDCLSEFCREMRKRDEGYLIGRYFRLNDDFNKRDEIAVTKTFSGLAKLLFPNEEMSKEDVRWLLDYSIEGRRRVKEQLKRMAGIEFMDVALGYSDKDAPGEATIVQVLEEPDETLITGALLPAGHVFAIGRSYAAGDFGLFRLENKAVGGDGRFIAEGLGIWGPVHESFNAAFKYFTNNVNRVAQGMRAMEKDYLLFFNDIQSKGKSDEVSLAEFIGLCSAACGRPVAAGLVVPGIIRMSGSMDKLTGLEEIVRVAKNAGAKRILLPFGCVADLQQVPSELMSGLSTDFYPDNDPIAAARQAIGL